jgi:PAS domain S-box-containing protein
LNLTLTSIKDLFSWYGAKKMSQKTLHKILLVDPNQLALEQHLSLQGGFQILNVTDGRSAIEATREARPDLVLINVEVPGLDVAEFCRLIRADADLLETPVIIYSPYRADSMLAVEALQSGADDYIETPIDPALLSAKVARHAERGSAIRRQKELEAELRYDGELLRALLGNIPDAIYFKDTEGRFTRANRHVPYRGNNSSEEVIGKTDFDFFVEQHARAAFMDEQRIIRTGEPVIDKEEKEIYPDGSTTWLSTTKAPIMNGEGRVTGIVGISRDITKRRLAEEALAAEKRFTEEAINTMTGIFYMLDEAGNLLRWNRMLEIVTGYSVNELRRMSAFDLFAPKERPLVADKMAEVFVLGEATVEAFLVAKDGSSRPFLLNGRMLRLSGGRYLIGTGIDVSERQQAVQERERLNCELQEALQEVKALRGILPVCMYCKNIQRDDNFWERIETYISNHSEAQLNHSICPDCYKKEMESQVKDRSGE